MDTGGAAPEPIEIAVMAKAPLASGYAIEECALALDVLAAWGGLSVSKTWVFWRPEDRIDRRFIAQFACRARAAMQWQLSDFFTHEVDRASPESRFYGYLPLPPYSYNTWRDPCLEKSGTPCRRTIRGQKG